LVALVPRPVMGWILSQDFRRLRALLGAEQGAASEAVEADSIQAGAGIVAR
jgi:hypothetical protein